VEEEIEEKVRRKKEEEKKQIGNVSKDNIIQIIHIHSAKINK